MGSSVEISRLESKSRQILLLVQQNIRPKQIRRFAVGGAGGLNYFGFGLYANAQADPPALRLEAFE